MAVALGVGFGDRRARTRCPPRLSAEAMWLHPLQTLDTTGRVVRVEVRIGEV
jgi:hypothetical protein